MFARRYFAGHMFAARYFPQSQGTAPVAPTFQRRILRMRQWGSMSSY